MLFQISVIHSFSQNYVFAQLKGIPINTAGWNLQGGARVGNISLSGNQELIVCPTNSLSGSVFYNEPINLSVCNKWKVEFDFRIFDGNGADGLAFCFLDVPPVGFVIGGGLGIPQNANGLKVCFDTWNNCIPFNPAHVHDNMPKIEIRYGNGYYECSNQPTDSNFDNHLSFIQSASYHQAQIEYNNGNIGVSIDGNLYLSGFQTFNFSGYLGFTASTGGYKDNHSIKNVIIHTDMPPSVAGSDIAICSNALGSLGNQPNANYLYQWSGPPGLSATNIANPHVTINNTGYNAIDAKYYVKTSFASNPGCSSLDSVNVHVFPRPKVNFQLPSICLTDAFAQFKDSTYSSDLFTLPYSYKWKFGDPYSSPTNPDSSTLQNAGHYYSKDSIYAVQLKVTTSQGCQNSILKFLKVNGSFPKANFNILSSSNKCSNKEFNIQNLSTVNFGGITRTEIWWDLNNEPNIFLVDSVPSFQQTYSHIYSSFHGEKSKSIIIKMKVYSGKTCMDEISKNITLYPLPSPSFPVQNSICENISPFKINVINDTYGNNGLGSFIGSGIDSAGIFHPLLAGAGIHKLSFIYTTDKGCIDSASSSIQVWPVPKVILPKEFVVLEKGSVRLNPTVSGIGLHYNWKPEIYLDNSLVLEPLCVPLNETYYTLTVTGTGGCFISDSTKVKILKAPVIPNAFSPNNDGINDNWAIKYLHTYPNSLIEVFNRYGQKVFHSIGYDQPWDGTYNGVALPIGSYYYIILPQVSLKPLSGTVTIIR